MSRHKRPEYRDPWTRWSEEAAASLEPPEPAQPPRPTCDHCYEPAELDELLEIVVVATGRTFYVHRPAGTRHVKCFGNRVGSTAVHRIASGGGAS